MVTIEGIGIYIALLLVFEIGPVERFDSLAKFRVFVESVPRIRQRGGVERDSGGKGTSTSVPPGE